MHRDTQTDHADVAVIGGGPSGLMAAVPAARGGMRTIVCEAGPRPGRKLLATGGGRCNLTHDGDIDTFLAGFDKSAARFLKHAAYRFPPAESMRYFESLGVPLKIERGGRVFPVSDRAGDILRALTAEAETAGVRIWTDCRVTVIERQNDGRFKIRTNTGDIVTHTVIVATGGLSMARTGATGDGYRLAGALGHAVVTPRPSLVPLVTAEDWPRTITGLALKNVTLTAKTATGRISRFGEMLFTHRGIGGPITLELSRFVTDQLHNGDSPVPVWIDLKPALDEHKLNARLLREIDAHPKRQLAGLLRALMPASLADVFVTHFVFDAECEANQLAREARVKLRILLKELPLTVTATEPVEAALVTRGGIDRGEIDPKTMMSRIVPGLFFAGEVMDVDGDCGGYNLQMCWATGMLAGGSAGEWVKMHRSGG